MVERDVTSRGLHGTEAQKALQATALADAPSARVRPGAVFAVRMRGTDNPERLGWDKIMKALSEDGAFAFRMIPAVQCAKVEQRLGEAGYRIDWWDVFEGEADDVLSAIETVLVSPGRFLQNSRDALNFDDRGCVFKWF